MPTDRPVQYRLRPARPADLDFVCALRERTVSRYIDEAFGWESSEQRDGCARELSRPGAAIVVVDDEDVGYLRFVIGDRQSDLDDLDLLPEHQSRGLGTQILRDLMARAAVVGVPVQLAVLRVNRGATRLYERLGFLRVREDDHTLWMIWRP